MTSDRWQQVAQIYESALEREPTLRAAFIADSCGTDAALRRDVEALLAEADTPLVIDRPLFDVAADVLRTDATLQANTQLGPYRIDRLVGVGGMGQVYQATDTRLHRIVALKVLPPLFAEDPLHRARFEREAHAIAGLTHANICTLHDVGHQDGVDFLVLEYLEGETLAARLARGPLPFDEGLAIAIQIASALDAAHRSGVIHRDLKPGNVFLVPSDRASAPPVVKLLDFGLAKPTAVRPAAETPTRAPLTAQGTILGTVQYMAPEQLEGRETDARTDLFAFGAVVYELFTGRKAFDGATQASVIGAIMHGNPPPVSQVQRLSPAGLDDLVATCLAKDPDERWQNTSDLLRELKRVRVGNGRAGAPVRYRLAYSVVAVVAAAALSAWAAAALNTDPPRPVTVSMINLAPSQEFTSMGRHVLALSADGTRVVYAAGQRLYMRSLDSLTATPVPGSGVPEATPNALGGTGGGAEAGRSPFFSPDGEWIGFWHDEQLKRVAVAGGAPVVICRADNPLGVSWSEDGTIWFGQGADGVWRVSSAGGNPTQVVTLKEGEQAHHPQLLPDGDTLMFTLAQGNFWDSAVIVAHSLTTGQRTVLLRGGTDARYLPTGHLVYVSQRTLLAVPFDLQSLKISGAPVAVAEDVAQSANNVTGAAQFAVSRDGTLLYVPSAAMSPTNRPRDIVWIDRNGRQERVNVPARPYIYPRLSPDGSRVAVEVRNEDGVSSEIWVVHPAGSLRRLTPEGVFSRAPLWLDARRLVFNSTPTGANTGELVTRAIDGSTATERLTPGQAEPAKWPTGVSPDRSKLVFTQDTHGIATRDVLMVALTGDRRVVPLVQTPAAESNGVVSPDGRWLAFESNASGSFEVYVRPFSDPAAAEWQISSGGGIQPLWSVDGRELFYLKPSSATLVSVPVERATTWRTGSARDILNGIYLGGGGFRSYDVSNDGNRFLVLKEQDRAGASDGAARGIVVVQNWFTELNRRVPPP
jgi:serine/threonine-protein kinase